MISILIAPGGNNYVVMIKRLSCNAIMKLRRNSLRDAYYHQSISKKTNSPRHDQWAI